MSAPPAPPRGLTTAEALERAARGLSNAVPATTSRTLQDILRANILTRFNLILGLLLLAVLVVGPIQDAAFGLVLVSNTLVGVVQELRAKRTLDRLAVVGAPRARVVRDGRPADLPVDEVVVDDLVEVARGGQVVVDGTVLAADALEVDESLLSGESEPVPKRVGSTLLSGSFAVAGRGTYRATRVGASAYGRSLAAEARRFSLVGSELRRGIDRILLLVGWAMPPIGVLLVVGQVRANGHPVDALRSSVAGLVTMVPEGLVLLTSLAFAVAVIRLGRRDVLVQELPAVEMLARVDVVCLDKTGTLTDGSLTVDTVDPVAGGPDAREALGALAAAEPDPNPSLRAVAAAFPPPAGWRPEAAVPFSSARRFSAVTFAGRGTWVLGATDVIGAGAPWGAALRDRAARHAAGGHRVLLAAWSPGPLGGDAVPTGCVPACLLLIRERLRPDAAATVGYFREQGVALKIVSGDDPVTAAAVASAVGITTTAAPVDARTLPEGDAFDRAVEDAVVLGRVDPHRKREVIEALRRRGHVVAMTGDGVNDVLALREADIGVAMGGGSDAARAAARLVLLGGGFAALPHAVAEGRRVIADVERVASLFVTKTVYAMLLALAVTAAGLPFPFLPRHLTLVGTVTIGVPAFFLALEPNARRAASGFVGRTLAFAGPAGAVAAAATFTAYALALRQASAPLDEARTTAAFVLAGVGLWLLSVVARPLNPWRTLLVGSMVATLVLAAVMPWTRTVFGLVTPDPLVTLAGVGVVALAVGAIEVGWRGAAVARRLLVHGGPAEAG